MSKSSDMQIREELAIAGLQEIYETVSAMQPLPKAGSPEAIAMHEAWMEQQRVLDDIRLAADLSALRAVPPVVRDMHDRVRNMIRKMRG